MLNEEVRRYRELSGDDNPHTPISRIGGYLDGYERALSEQRTGHWEWVQYDGNPKIGNWHCSECRSIVIEGVSKEKKGGIPLYKYCPQCGAKIE